MLKKYLDGINYSKITATINYLFSSKENQELGEGEREGIYPMKNMKKSIILALLIFLSSCTKKEKNIEIIDLSGLKLTQIPDSVFTHTELKELYLGAAGFIYYPALSGMLSTTQTGDLVNNLTELDTRISELKNLKILNLTSNRLKELPDALTAYATKIA